MTYASGTEETALALLDNPHQIEGISKATSPYMIMFNDVLGSSPIGGGTALVFGFEYANDLYGFQQAMQFNGNFRKRNKYNGTWTSWTSI